MLGPGFRPVALKIDTGRDGHHSTSAVLLQDHLVLCPLSAFLPAILDSSATAFSPAILRCLDKDTPFPTYDDLATSGGDLRDWRCTVSIDNNSKRESIPSRPQLIFSSRVIRKTFEELFRHSPSLKLAKDDRLTAGERALVLSSFLVLDIAPGSITEAAITGQPAVSVQSGQCSVIATPYGNTVMQGTTFHCQIANVINSVLILLDQPLSKGCEGGLLLNAHTQPIGMILTTTFHGSSENVNLTLAADLNEIRLGLDGLLKVTPPAAAMQVHQVKSDPAAKSVVLIESGRNSYGTGTLIRVDKKLLILTCSHVVVDKRNNYCTWMGRRYRIQLLYKNPIHDRPYDVAVFQAPAKIPSSAFCRSSISNPIVGE